MNQTMWAAKIEGGKYLYDKVPLVTNRWIDTPPYAMTDVVAIQTENDEVMLGEVLCDLEKESDGKYGIGRLYSIYYDEHGCHYPVKYYMYIPFPFEDPKGWNFTADEMRTPKKGKEYIVAVEDRRPVFGSKNVSVRYRLETGQYDPKRDAWFHIASGASDVIAWRAFPRAKR